MGEVSVPDNEEKIEKLNVHKSNLRTIRLLVKLKPTDTGSDV